MALPLSNDGDDTMARFFLNIRDGEHMVRDSQVYHFPTAQDARDAAVQSVRELIMESRQDFDGKEIEIADITGHTIATVGLHDVMLSGKYH
jgi:hypothetical protein